MNKRLRKRSIVAALEEVMSRPLSSPQCSFKLLHIIAINATISIFTITLADNCWVVSCTCIVHNTQPSSGFILGPKYPVSQIGSLWALSTHRRKFLNFVINNNKYTVFISMKGGLVTNWLFGNNQLCEIYLRSITNFWFGFCTVYSPINYLSKEIKDFSHVK